jgi:hypothetical protein
MNPRRLLAQPVLLPCWLALRLLDLSIRQFGVGTTYRALARTSPRPWREPARIGPLGRIAVRAVAAARPHRRDFCLRRSLLIWWILRWHGIAADIHCATGLDQGHAWVEYQGVVLGDRQALAGTGRFGRFSTLFARRKLPAGS